MNDTMSADGREQAEPVCCEQRMPAVNNAHDTIDRIRLAHAGDHGARDALVLENTGLVWSVVRRFAGRGHDLEDLYQIGCIGLIKAIDHFDPEFEVRFSTYAVPLILGEVRRFLRDDGLLKVSRSLKELGLKAARARERLMIELSREPTVEEIAAVLGASREEVAASLEAAAEVESIYRQVGGGEDTNLCILDRIPDGSDQSDRLMNRLVLEELLAGLGERDREIIFRRYFENETQAGIARDLNISQVQVSRLEKRILRELRAQLEES